MAHPAVGTTAAPIATTRHDPRLKSQIQALRWPVRLDAPRKPGSASSGLVALTSISATPSAAVIITATVPVSTTVTSTMITGATILVSTTGTKVAGWTASEVTGPASATTGPHLCLGLIYPNCSPVQLLAVHFGDRLVSTGRIGKRYKSKTSGSAGVPIGDDLRFGHLTETGKGLFEPIVGGSPAKTTNKQFFRHRCSL